MYHIFQVYYSPSKLSNKLSPNMYPLQLPEGTGELSSTYPKRSFGVSLSDAGWWIYSSS